MTIHSGHPFATPDDAKSVVRRLRGRLAAPITVVATGSGRDRVGLTVSSLLVVEPDQVIFVINELADLADELDVDSTAAVTVLEPDDEPIAEVFASRAPAPGGMFTAGEWTDSDWGPRLLNRSWAGVRVTQIGDLAWSKIITATIEHIELTEADAAIHVRGRFRE